MKDVISLQHVEEKIITLRNEPVLLDSDVAALYGVETKRINEAVKNNPDKFPDGYAFYLQNAEKQEVVENFDHLANLKFSSQMPRAFTEKGLYMLATILKSSQATATTLAIVETFTQFRQLARTVKALAETEDKEKQKSLMEKSGALFSELLGDDTFSTETETTLKLNLAVLSLQHTVKRVKKDKGTKKEI